MSRPLVTDAIIDGLAFAKACVMDQRTASHARKDHQWDDQYYAAIEAIGLITAAHKRWLKTRKSK